jgi:hypothetical protein
MIAELLEDFLPHIIIGVLLLLLVGVVCYEVKNNKREAAACARAWTIARTSADSLAVIRMCEVKDSKTIVIPQPIYIPSR